MFLLKLCLAISYVITNCYSFNSTYHLTQFNSTFNQTTDVEDSKSVQDLKGIFQQANLELKKKNFSEALKNFNELLKLSPANRVFNAKIALCFYELKSYEKALFHADQALAQNDIYSFAKQIKAVSLFKMAKISFKKKNYSQAEDYYLKALLFRPNDKLILTSFADLLYSKEQYEDAANYAQLALNIDSNFKFSRLILSKSLLKLGQIEFYVKGNPERALRFLIKSSKLEPNKLIYKDMAFVYSSLNNYDKAIEYADLVLFQNKNDSLAKEIKATCLLNKAESSFQSENYKEFIFYLEKSFELVSGEASIYVHYASVFFELKYYENALHYAQKTLESDPENQLANDIRSESFKCLKFDWNYFLIHC